MTTRSSQAKGFTAVELLIVLLIISILTAMAIPAVVGMLRRTAVMNACLTVQDLWGRARNLSQQTTVEGGQSGAGVSRHYGVALKQEAGAGLQVMLIYGNDANWKVLKEGDEEVVRSVPSSVLCMVSSGDEPEKYEPLSELTWFASYGSGMPISPDGLMAGEAAVPFQFGLRSPVLRGSDDVFAMRIQTIDYNEGDIGSYLDEDEKGEGEAFMVTLSSSGYLGIQECR